MTNNRIRSWVLIPFSASFITFVLFTSVLMEVKRTDVEGQEITFTILDPKNAKWLLWCSIAGQFYLFCFELKEMFKFPKDYFFSGQIAQNFIDLA